MGGLNRGGTLAEQQKTLPLPTLKLIFSAPGFPRKPLVGFANEGFQEVVELFGLVRYWRISFDNGGGGWEITWVGGGRIC